MNRTGRSSDSLHFRRLPIRGDSGLSAESLFRNLQQRGLLRIFTGFPIKVYRGDTPPMPCKASKIPERSLTGSAFLARPDYGRRIRSRCARRCPPARAGDAFLIIQRQDPADFFGFVMRRCWVWEGAIRNVGKYPMWTPRSCFLISHRSDRTPPMTIRPPAVRQTGVFDYSE